jgi:hypothetical protein
MTPPFIITGPTPFLDFYSFLLKLQSRGSEKEHVVRHASFHSSSSELLMIFVKFYLGGWFPKNGQIFQKYGGSSRPF